MSLFRIISPKLVLIFICLFFLFTRLFKITEIPASLYWDEASIGYNAYSIAEGGKDEWGRSFPIHFRAFGEFKLPVYIYATVLSVKLFGLNEFSVRLPAVIFSLGVVILTYFLAKKLWGNETVGLLSSFFVAISPWFFIFSRTGYEATAGLMFFILGLYLFLYMKEKIFLLIPSSLSFILSMYSYNSFRIIVPLTLIILAVIYYDRLVYVHAVKASSAYHTKAKILVLISSALILLSLVPIIRLAKDGGAVRLQTVGILSTSNQSELLIKFTQNYLSHFSPDFLILRGDKNLRSQQAGFGQLYLPELILLPLGLLYLIRSKSKYRLLPLLLLLLGPIPAAITKESPHALRAISMVPFISIISAIGTTTLWQWTSKKKLISLTVSIIFLAFFTNYFLSFLNTYPADSATEWQNEYKQSLQQLRCCKKIYTDYNRIFISDKFAQPYIFALFYLKYDPQKFRQEVIRNNPDQWGFSTVKSFGKFEFGKFPELITFEK